MTLIGPKPELPETPTYPVPWGRENSVLKDANGVEIMSGAGGKLLELWDAIAEAINEKYGKPNVTTNEDPSVRYFIYRYTNLLPDIWKFVNGVCTGFSSGLTWDRTRASDRADLDELATSEYHEEITYDQLPEALK